MNRMLITAPLAAMPSAGAIPTTPVPSAGGPSAGPDPDLVRTAKPKPRPTKAPSTKVLDYRYEAQINGYYCGPAAVRNALSAAGAERTQDELAVPLGTTELGTNSAYDTTRVLNQVVKGDPYRTRMIPGPVTAAQSAQLRADVLRAVTAGRAIVANVAGDATDTAGGWHSFPGGHYVAVVGYRDNGRTVRIADSADPANPSYWMTTTALADWMVTRGYSA